MRKSQSDKIKNALRDYDKESRQHGIGSKEERRAQAVLNRAAGNSTPEEIQHAYRTGGYKIAFREGK
jgi:hypothetical protein